MDLDNSTKAAEEDDGLIEEPRIDRSNTQDEVVDLKDWSIDNDDGVDPNNDNVDLKDIENRVTGATYTNKGKDLVHGVDPSSAHDKDSYGNLSVLLLGGGRDSRDNEGGAPPSLSSNDMALKLSEFSSLIQKS